MADNGHLTSFAPGQSKKKLRENMSAKTNLVQTTGLESTLNNENKYEFTTEKWTAQSSGGMCAKIEPT